jgi:hypothetical protein
MVKLSPFLVKSADNSGPRSPGSSVGRADDRSVQGWRVSLSRQFELAGKSGARYRYVSFEEDRFLPPAGANFVIARVTKDGATDNLANQSWRTTLEKARETYRDAALLTRLNVTRAVREAERVDLIAEHQPSMNG